MEIKNNSEPVIDSFLSCIIYYFIITIIDIILTKLKIIGSMFFIIITILNSLVLFFILFLFLRNLKIKEKINWELDNIIPSILNGICVGLLVSIIALISIHFKGEYLFSLISLENLKSSCGKVNIIEKIFILLGFSILMPVSEEIFFRGWIYNSLKNKINWKYSAFITSILSSLFLIGNISYFLLFIISGFFTILYEKKRLIWLNIIGHIICNLSILVAIWIKCGG